MLEEYRENVVSFRRLTVNNGSITRGTFFFKLVLFYFDILYSQIYIAKFEDLFEWKATRYSTHRSSKKQTPPLPPPPPPLKKGKRSEN